MAELSAIFARLFFERVKERLPADAGREAGNVVARRYPPRPRLAVIEDDTATPKSPQVNRRRQPRGAGTDDDRIQYSGYSSSSPSLAGSKMM
jgi:hypothetical protein